MPQKHDQKFKKRQPAALPDPVLDTERLARELVENGLASPQILDARATFSRRKETSA